MRNRLPTEYEREDSKLSLFKSRAVTHAKLAV